MNIELTSTSHSIGAATVYLASKGALGKLADPVLCLFSCPHHGKQWRINRSNRIDRMKRKMTSLWSVPVSMI